MRGDVAGLYLETPSKDAAAIMASDSGRGLRMHFLRSVGRSGKGTHHQAMHPGSPSGTATKQPPTASKTLKISSKKATSRSLESLPIAVNQASDESGGVGGEISRVLRKSIL